MPSAPIRFLVVGFCPGDADQVISAARPWHAEVASRRLLDSAIAGSGCARMGVIAPVSSPDDFSWLIDILKSAPHLATVAVGQAFEHPLWADAFEAGLGDHVQMEELALLPQYLARAAARASRVTRLLDEHERYRAAVEERRRRAEQMAQVGEMAARLSHEIKNPLAAVIAGLELLDEAAMTPQEQRETMREVKREARLIAKTVGELLSCAAEAPLQVECTTVQQPVLDAVSSCRTLARSTGVELRTKIDVVPSTPVIADATWLRRALTNLLINGIEATGQGGKVEVFVGLMQGQQKTDLLGDFPNDVVRIEVRDDGPGVPREHIDRVFEAFFTTKAGGTGLGLCVAADVVESFGGVLSLESRPGRGCSFQIYLASHGVKPCWQIEPCQSDVCPARTHGQGLACWAIHRAPGSPPPGCGHPNCSRCPVFQKGCLRPYWTRSLVRCAEV